MWKSFEIECICGISEGEHEHSPVCYHGNDVLEIFDDFNTKLTTSASIGKVYKAFSKGKKVCRKA